MMIRMMLIGFSFVILRSLLLLLLQFAGQPVLAAFLKFSVDNPFGGGLPGDQPGLHGYLSKGGANRPCCLFQ